MAINFLNTVDLNQNQLNQAAIQSLAANPASGVIGQIYFNTVAQTIRVYKEILPATSPKTYEWASVSGDLTGLIAGTYINIDNPDGPIPTINHNLTTRTDTALPAGGESPGYGGNFDVVDSITTNTTGHITAINVNNITLPADTNETYTLPTSTGETVTQPLSGKIELTAGGTGSGVKSTVNFVGTTNRIKVSGAAPVSAIGDITFDLTDDVTIVDDLTVGGELTVSGTGQSSFGGQVTIPETPSAPTDAASKKFVLDQVAGLGSFQGGYDASTDPGSPALTGASNIAFGQGDFYAVTTAGTITFSDSPTGDATLEVGDFIFSNTDIAANSDPASTDFTLILADQNIAGSGATDGATPKGVAGFDSANFDVSATGWVQLNSQRNPYGAKTVLDNGGSAGTPTSAVVRTTSGTPVDQTTFTIDIDSAFIFGTGALAANVKVEVLDNASPFETVYPLVERSGSGTIAIKFTGDVAVDLYQVLLTHI